MRTVNSYITRNMLETTGMALGILTFVMLSGHFYRVFELLSKGVPIGTLLYAIGLLLPEVLRIALPLALLVSTVLVFSRMSADCEIIALKSMGISIWQTVLPAITLSFIFTLLCLWLSLWVAPTCRYRSELLRQEALLETPLNLLEPNEFSHVFDQCSLRIGSRSGNKIYDVHIIIGEKGSRRCQDISAASGVMVLDKEKGALELNLKDVKVTDFSLATAPTPEDTKVVEAKSVSIPISLGSTRRSTWAVWRKPKYLTVRELCAKIGQTALAGGDTSSMVLELHSRFAMALSPFAFLLLGLPFGIRSRRSELSVGLLICVLLALVFYAFAMLSNALRKVSGLHPEAIIWIPNIVYQAVGLYMLKKLERQG